MNSLRHEGYFRSSVVRHVWEDHLKGNRDHARRLWGILMFQAWLEKQ